MGTDLKFEFEVNIAPVQHRCYRYRMVKIISEPKLRQHLVLAYQIQDMLERDPTITAKQIAGWLNMTPPRISQILDLLLLCPAIQKDILLSKDKKVHDRTEHKILAITKEIDWQKQQAMWADLLK